MRIFLLIVLAGLVCAALGGGFGWLIGSLSPEFLALLAEPYPVDEPQRLGAALGLVSGLLLGVVLMAFGVGVETLRLWITRGKASREVSPSGTRFAEREMEAEPSSLHVRPV
jgi:hypothetical protein